ncbi:TPA: hypothetical protein ACH3X1_015800 [Trebouxia sp. C0004]
MSVGKGGQFNSAGQLGNASKPVMHAFGVKNPVHADDMIAQSTATGKITLCQYVRQLLEPAFTAVPAAVDIQALFQSALQISGTLPFPVPEAFYESQRLLNRDMEFYLVPVSKSGAVTFSSRIHNVLCKQFPAGTESCKQVCF